MSDLYGLNTGPGLIAWALIIPQMWIIGEDSGINIFKMICPGIVFPCAISATKGIAESLVTALPPGLQRNSFTANVVRSLHTFPNRKLNKHLHSARRNFLGNFKGQPMVRGYCYCLFNGHGKIIA